MKRAATALCFLLALPAYAGWQFSPAVEVGAVAGSKIFHHLESANREGLAESAGRVALVWEDNRKGNPRCWLAVSKAEAVNFGAPQAISSEECYEPVVQGMGNGRFVVAWEAGGAVWVRPADGSHAIKLSHEEASQITLARVNDHTLYAAWAEQAGDYRHIVIARLLLEGHGLRVEYAAPLEDQPPTDDQGYPTLAVSADGSVTALWEDRRFKHTVMLVAHSPDGRKFGLPYRLIDVPQARSRTLGAGMGSMRPTLASCGPECLVAVWLDKRDFLSGYDVYAAFSHNGGRFFTRNLKVQDSFGDNMAQWHAAVAANQAGRVVAVWDDERDGTSDVWLSNWTGDGFSDNLAVPGASGEGAQGDPVIHLDAAGKLHLAWLEKNEDGGTRLKYASAVWKD